MLMTLACVLYGTVLHKLYISYVCGYCPSCQLIVGYYQDYIIVVMLVCVCFQALRKIGQDFLILMLCVTVFLSYLPEAGEYSSFFVYLRLVISTGSVMELLSSLILFSFHLFIPLFS